MLKYYNYDIVFQEIPDEVTFAVNLSNCPNCCRGCHSPHLQQDVGEIVSLSCIQHWMKKYSSAITCFCFMGGDQYPQQVAELAAYIRENYPKLKTAWYSGRSELPQDIDSTHFHFIKLGPYVEKLGGLKSKTTNQRLYKILPDGSREDITFRFW